MELLKYYNNYIKQIIIIQKNIRRYIIKKNILIPKSLYQTKIWRKNRLWYKNGKYNECEKYQISIIEKIINLNLRRTDERINIENNSIINNKNPLINNDGYEWTENFDGKIIKNNNIYYFNLKFICDFGGAQNRTLREIYHFIKYQMEYLLNNNNNIYFINILDGDNSYHNINKFNYLKNNEKYKNNIKNIFIGSLYDFQKNKYIYNL